ncbi:MAG: sialidase family protein [Armatimonadota bacterium]
MKVAMTVMLTLFVAGQAVLGEYKGDIWIHPDAERLPTDQQGPFVRLSDGRVMAVGHNQILFSDDDGQSWESRPMYEGVENVEDTGGGVLFRTREGVILRAFLNFAHKNFAWDYEGVGPLPECQLPVYITRSLDEGETWEQPRELQEGWCGYVHNMIQLDSGRLVLVSQVAVPDPGHHVSFTWVSDDLGEHWQRSNLIDLGGEGDHAGGIEPTVVELEDGRLWMLIRTYSGRFWEAYSSDEGLTWDYIRASDIEASGAPGILLRLASGRIILVWNRFAEGRPKKIGRREEISIAFSEDEGRTWTEPVVVARNRTPEGGNPVEYRISYPDVYEHEPGEIWITTGQGMLRMKLYESDFVK